jgi:predicted phage-related endonuclease
MDPATCRALGFTDDGKLARLPLFGLTPEDILARRNFIGGSDATVIYKGDPKEVGKLRAVKRGEREPDDLSNLIYVQLGLWTEAFILAWGAKQNGWTVTRRGERVRDTRRPWMAATLDGWLDDDGKGRRAVLQAKHVNAWTKDQEVVDKYGAAQLQHEMHCAKAEVAYLCVLFGTLRFEVFEVGQDLDLLADLIRAEEAFWASVQSGERTEPVALAKRTIKVVPVRQGEQDMALSNAWADAAGRFLEALPMKEAYDQAHGELKGLLPEGIKRAYGHGVEVTASKSNAITVRPLKAATEEAA